MPSEEDKQAPATNGAADPQAAEATAPKRKGRPKKDAREVREPVQDQAEADAETQAEVEDEGDVMDLATAQQAVRDALNKYYVEVYGMDATQADILKLYAMRFPDGGVTKVSDIPEGMHATVIEDIKDMARTNHFKRTPVNL